MLRTRLLVGFPLAALMLGVLGVDSAFAPWFPFLMALMVFLTVLATHELLTLLDPTRRPPAWLCYPATLTLLLANWTPVVTGQPAWSTLFGVFTLVILAAFVREVVRYDGSGQALNRVALTVWLVAYLAVLPSFLVQLRIGVADVTRSGWGLALAIFVPKGADIGAYFAGRMFGRTRIAPTLSPAKTLEGAVGGLIFGTLVGAAFVLLAPAGVLPMTPWGVWPSVVGFGLTVGLVGTLGDLAESLVKRDCRTKDASQVVPGFGGVLDVVDSIVFAAPVAWWWLR